MLPCCTSDLKRRMNTIPLARKGFPTRPSNGTTAFLISGKTPMQTFLDAMPMTKEKMIAA